MTAKKKAELKRTCGKNGVPALMAIPDVIPEPTICRPVIVGGFIPIRWSTRRAVAREHDPYRWN